MIIVLIFRNTTFFYFQITLVIKHYNNRFILQYILCPLYQYFARFILNIIVKIQNNRLMPNNVIDVTHIVTLSTTTNSHQDYSIPVRQISKSKSTLGSLTSQQIIRSSSAIIKPNRQQSMKNSKKRAACYEVMDSKKIIIHRGSSAVSFTFDHVEESIKKFENMMNWLFSKNKVSQQIEMNVLCKLIIAHNYSPSNSQNLMESIGKKLLSEGFSFEVYSFWNIKHHANFYQPQQNKKRKKNNLFKDEFDQPQSGFGKSIKFVSQLKQYINDIRCIRQPISKFWIISPYLKLGVGVSPIFKQQTAIEIVQQLMSDYQLYSNEQQESINFKVAIYTLSDSPNQTNLQQCKALLEDAVLLRNCVKKLAISGKKSTKLDHNKDESIKLNEKERRKRSSHDVKYNYQNTRKNSSNNQYLERISDMQGSDKIKMEQKESESSSNSNKHKKLTQDKLTMLSRQSENNLASLMAQNMNLKWQLQTIQKEYQDQSQKFVKKSNKKLESMRQQRSYILQQNAKLRKDNEDLLAQISLLKVEYEQVLKSRTEYEQIIKIKSDENQKILMKNSQNQAKGLQIKISQLVKLNQNLQTQIQSYKLSLEDARRRNKQKIQQVIQQMNMYKKFSEEIKAAYDQIQRQAYLDKDRCENLQKRCKKYQQTLNDLLKIKQSSNTDSLDLESNIVQVLSDKNMRSERNSQKDFEKSKNSRNSKEVKYMKQQLEEKLFGQEAKRARKWSKRSQKVSDYYQEHKQNRKMKERKTNEGKQIKSDENQTLISFGR